MVKGITKEQEEFFWSKVDIKKSDKECWEWLGARKPGGYGNTKINGRYLLSHRVVWELINFEIPKGYVICHVCDNPPCCNPHHLMLGTIKSNAIDMVKKNRQGKKNILHYGMKNVNAKMTWEEVQEARQLRAEGMLMKDIAKRYNVSSTCIRSIVNFKTRKYA